MMSNIEWTEKTWNPIAGCTKVSPGCKHCYAETMAKRLAAMGQEKYQAVVNDSGRWNGRIYFDEKALLEPLRRKKPTVYFVNSMSDLFHEGVLTEWVDKIFAVMALCPQHTFQVLTKRPERMAEYLNDGGDDLVGCDDYGREVSRRRRLRNEVIWDEMKRLQHEDHMRLIYYSAIKPDERGWPLPNVWIGTSVENQEAADERIPHLLRCPAAVRFLSVEPMLGPVDLYNGDPDPRLGGLVAKNTFIGEWWEPGDDPKGPPRHGVDWVICGGESGEGARPLDVVWARSLKDQCESAGVAFFLKQLGAKPRISGLKFITGNDVDVVELKSRKGGDMSEWPEDLRVRQMPKGVA